MKQISLRKSRKIRIGDKYNLRLPYRQLDLLGNGNEKMPTAKVKEAINVPTGEYTGTILSNEVVKRGTNEEYEYHETTIKLSTKDKEELKLGVPFNISKGTTLGNILLRMGAKLEKGEDIDTDKYLMPKMMVKFSVVRKTIEGSNGKFEVSNIIADTLEPVKTLKDVS